MGLAELQIPYHNSIVQILRDALDASGGEYSLFQELVMNEIDLIAENIVEMHSVVRQARQAVIDARRRTQDVQMFQYVEMQGGGRAGGCADGCLMQYCEEF